MSKRNEIWQAIEIGLRTGKKKEPRWPQHPAAQAAVVCNASGALVRAALEYKYDRGAESDQLKEQMKNAAIETAAMAIRFLENLKLDEAIESPVILAEFDAEVNATIVA